MRKEYTKVQWTDDMEQFIRDNYKTMHDKDIAEALGISPSHVKNKRYRMRIAKEKEVPKDVINYGVEAVRDGMSYSAAVKHCYEKFGVKFNLSTLIRYCEKAGVVSPKANKEFNPTSQDARKYKELELYNARLNAIKQKVRVGDKILVMSGRSKTVIEKYPSFVICITRGFREAIQYTEIRKIVQ